MSVLVIDVGTTFIKTAWGDRNAVALRDVRTMPFPAFTPGLHESRREADVETIVAAVDRSLDMALADRPCEGIYVCGQMHGLVVCDDALRPHTAFVSWQDARADVGGPAIRPASERVRAAVGPEARIRTGNELDQIRPVMTLVALRDSGALPAGSTPASLLDYLVARLTHADVVTHPTNAAAYGALDVGAARWDAEVIGALALDDLKWPELRRTGFVAGYRGGVPVHVAVGDQQAALLGVDVRPGELSLNISTGGQVAEISNAASSSRCQVRPWFDGRFLHTVTRLPAGRGIADHVLRIARELSGAAIDADAAWTCVTGVLDESRPLSERERQARDQMLVAFDEIAEGARGAASRLPSAPQWERLVYSGGLLTRQPLLQRAIEKRFPGVERRTAGTDHDALLGLCRLAAGWR